MAKSIRIQVSMDPVAKGRPRVVVKDGNVRTFTPEKTQIAETELRARFLPYQDRAFPQYTPVRFSIKILLTKSKHQKKAKHLPCIRPDIDNLVKTIQDAANGILFYDDAQITTLNVRKRWTDDKNPEAGIRIELEEDRI